MTAKELSFLCRVQGVNAWLMWFRIWTKNGFPCWKHLHATVWLAERELDTYTHARGFQLPRVARSGQ